MKLSSRILALFLAVIFSVTAFVGCNTDNAGNDGTNNPVTTVDPGSDSGSDSGSGSGSVNEPNTPAGDSIKINASNLSEYKIVIPSSASDDIKTAASELAAFFTEKFGATVETVKDSAEVGAKELILGLTSRPLSTSLTMDLNYGEYGIVVDGGSIYFVGYNGANVNESVKLFAERYFNATNNEVSLSLNEEYYVSTRFIKKLRIDGVDIKDYKIVISKNADLLTKYAAENLKDYLNANMGITMSVYTDAYAESKYEILIGETSRAADDNNVTAADGEYVLYKKDGKIICQGENIWVGASIGAIISRFPSEGKAHIINITDIPETPAARKFEFKEARNAILMIGDGMGFNTVDMYKADKNTVFYAEYLLNKGNAYTGSVNTQSNPSTPTDSAAGGTALSSGYKTVNGYLGINENKVVVQNVRELAYSKGCRTAVLTTDKITGATPSAFLIHHNNRNDTAGIQEKLDELVASKGVTTALGDLDYELAPKMVSTLKLLSRNNFSFFMMLEEGHIDKRSHAVDRAGCVKMMDRFNDVIAYAIEFTLCHPDTVLIITADHETGGIKKTANGDFVYTPLPNNPNKAEHSTANVPVYALGYGTEYFSNKEVDNTEIAKFIAKIYGAVNFGA